MIPLSRIPRGILVPAVVVAIGIIGFAVYLAVRPADPTTAAVAAVRAGATSEQTAQETDAQLAQQMQSVCSEIRGGHSVQTVGDEMSSNVSYHFTPPLNLADSVERASETSDAGLILRSAVLHLCPEFSGQLSR